MYIKHFSCPFYHTIIYNFFEKNEVIKIVDEISNYDEIQRNQDDIHHNNLHKFNDTIAFSVDELFDNNRENSILLKLLEKINSLNLSQFKDKNPFLGYFPCTNLDNTFVQRYKNGSFYPPHDDGSAILTFLCPLYLQEFVGGELNFITYNYQPLLKHNSLLIFPSYEIHELNQIESNSNGYVRYSINKRYFITAT
jgi:hypothetical protein